MALPKFPTDNSALEHLQSTWATVLNPVVDNPANAGTVLKSVVLASGANVISHKLGRKLQGWFFTRQRATGSAYDTQDTNVRPELTLLLTASAAMTVDIYVF